MTKRLFFFIMAMALCMQNVAAQKYQKVPRLYVFGIAASFNDSVVYITDIQQVDSAWMATKTKFLLGRNNYSNQLKEFMTSKKKEENRTCITYYAYERKNIEKKYLKTKNKYTKKGDFDVRYITSEDFRYQPVEPYENDEESGPTAGKKQEGKKKNKKKRH